MDVNVRDSRDSRDMRMSSGDRSMQYDRSAASVPMAHAHSKTSFSDYGQFLAYVCVSLFALRLVLQDAWYTTLAWSPAFPADWESTIAVRNAMLVLTPYMLLQLFIIVPQMFLTPVFRDARNALRITNDRFVLGAWIAIAIINVGSTYHGLYVDMRNVDIPSIFVDVSLVDMSDPMYAILCFFIAVFVSIAPERILRQSISRASDAWRQIKGGR
jgi:uncharacterized membrane protein